MYLIRIYAKCKPCFNDLFKFFFFMWKSKPDYTKMLITYLYSKVSGCALTNKHNSNMYCSIFNRMYKYTTVLGFGHYIPEPSQLTAKQRFCYSDFVGVILSQSEGLGKMALEIVKIYLGSPFSAN